MEEMFHSGQIIDRKNELLKNSEKINVNDLVSGTIKKEIEAKTWVAENFKDYEKYWNSGDYEVPTELGIMGGNFKDIDKSKYLISGIEYPCKNKQNAIILPIHIGGMYYKFPLK